MALGIFSAQCIINSSMPSGSNFIVNATVNDLAGLFTGFDVSVGDLIFIDISGMPVDNAYVARYKIVNIIDQSPYLIDVEIQFEDGGTVPDPNDYVGGNPGFICAPSPNLGLAWVASASIQQVSEYIVTYAIDNNFWLIDSASLSGYSGSSGYSGFGLSGYSGFSGDSGVSGFSGETGVSGYSGGDGNSGYSGYSGASGQVVTQSDHALLSNLDYNNANHTGFQRTLIYDPDYQIYFVPFSN